MGVKAFPCGGFRIGWFVEVDVKPKDKSKRPGAKAPIVRIRVDMSDSAKLPQTPESIMENTDRLRASLDDLELQELDREHLSPEAQARTNVGLLRDARKKRSRRLPKSLGRRSEVRR